MSRPEPNSKRQPGPPRMLLGISLLFWGGMIAHPIIGLALAVAIEAAHWTRVRWDFGDRAYYRAWQISVLLLLFTGVLIWMSSSDVASLPNTVAWLPVLSFPLQFVQSYGMHRTMPLATFSLFVRKRREHARRHGLPFRDIQIPFGHIYFSLILVSSSLGVFSKEFLFFPGMVLLVAWSFHRQFSWSRRLAPISALLLLGLAIGGGLGGDKALTMIYDRLISEGGGGSGNDANFTHTSIGSLEEIKQSPNIIWRMKPVSGNLPKLLRVSSYNNYLNTYWRAEVPPDADDRRPVTDFVELDSIGIENPFRITARQNAESFVSGDVATDDSLPRFILRGALAQRDLLPIPSNTACVVIPTQNLEINSLGTLRVDPKHPVANATILWDPILSTGKPPWKVAKSRGLRCPDLSIPKHEQRGIRRVASELDLHEGSLSEKIAKLHGHFLQNFTYSRYLSDPRPDTPRGRNGFVTIFLEETRRGHCEYFATATAMLLREAGVPTRYATGFSVHEFNRSTGEALLRGIHAHAWCEAWDAESKTWIDVDLTPPDWTGLETPRMPPWQGMLDRWQMLRDDLLVWRSEPGNLAIALAIIFLPLLLGALLIGRRLWKSKRRLGPATERRVASAAHPTTPLSAIEKTAARHLGPRPSGTPLGSWLLGLSSTIPEPSHLQEAIALHRTIRFDPTVDPSPLDQRLTALVTQLKDDLKP